MNYLGKDWGFGAPRFPNNLVKSYTEYVTAQGGVVTWDVPLEYNGLIAKPFLDQLSNLKSGS